MSALYKTTVKSRDATTGTVKIHVESIHPDSGEPEAEIPFAMQILSDFLRVVMNPVIKWQIGSPRDNIPEPPTKDEEIPPLNDEITADSLSEDWLLQHSTAYVKDVSYDASEKILTIIPTSPFWTEQCHPLGFASSYDTASYVVGRSMNKDCDEALTTKVDRTSIPEPSEDPFAGFKIVLPKEFRVKKESGRGELRRERVDGDSNTATNNTNKTAVGFGGFGASSAATTSSSATSFSASTSGASGFGASGFGGQKQDTKNVESTTTTKAPEVTTTASGFVQPKASQTSNSTSGFTSGAGGFGGGGGVSGFGGASGFGASNSSSGGFGFGTAAISSSTDQKPTGFGGSSAVAGFGGSSSTSSFVAGTSSSSSEGFAHLRPKEDLKMKLNPEVELPIPLYQSIKYCAVKPLPAAEDLIRLPVLYKPSFGGSSSSKGALEIGTVFNLSDDKKTAYIYYEADIVSSRVTCPIENISGRATLMKPRKRTS